MTFDLVFMLRDVLPKLILAIPLSLFLVASSGVIGNILAVPVALARISHNPLLWMPAYGFILLMRGTPLLIQIYLIYYGLGQVFGGITIGDQRLMQVLPFLKYGLWYAVFALAINTAGYSGEILRGAILAVPHGEIEAGKAFGMSKWKIFRRITLPRAVRICLPAMSTETILLLKATSLASTVTVYEVLGTAQFIRQQSFRVYETQAIIRYLDEIYIHPPLTPGNPKDRTRMNQVIGIIEWYFFPKAAAPIAFNRIIGPRLLGLPSNEEAIAEAMPMARTAFAELDHLLGDKPYFTGETISVADIMLGAQLDLLSTTPEGAELIAGTRLVPWLERMRARPSFLATQPPEALRRAA